MHNGIIMTKERYFLKRWDENEIYSWKINEKGDRTGK